MQPLDVSDYAGSIDLAEPSPVAQVVDDTAGAVDELVAMLDEEMPEAVARLRRQLPEDHRALLRALLTLRPPAPLPRSFHALLDGLLVRERQERGIVHALALPRLGEILPGKEPLASCALFQGDITTLQADAIVNAANSALLGCFVPFHACIDNAIHDRAGPRLRADCHVIMTAQKSPEPVGLAKVTRAYSLPARYVIHTVGPTVRGRLDATHMDQLSSSYESCLDLAVKIGARTIALCAISTGLFGFPKMPAARIALATVERFLRRWPGALDLVIFNVFSSEDHATYLSALREKGKS
jgi:O-acetyl-ADP-ribose deacetylase (regulator of RNase III)